MHKLVITMYEDDDETTVTHSGPIITWGEAHKVFFRMLRGAGYIINGAAYIEAVTEDVTELVEAEKRFSVGVSIDVGGDGFISGDDNV
jgi:hypothetical protein